MPSEMTHEGIGPASGLASTAPSPIWEGHISLALSLDVGLDNLNTTGPFSLGPGPTSPNSTCLDPLPILCLHNEDWWDPAVGNSSLIEATRNRFRVEFGKLGRNIRQRLLCGFCVKEGNPEILINCFDYVLLHFKQCHDFMCPANLIG